MERWWVRRMGWQMAATRERKVSAVEEVGPGRGLMKMMLGVGGRWRALRRWMPMGIVVGLGGAVFGREDEVGLSLLLMG